MWYGTVRRCTLVVAETPGAGSGRLLALPVTRVRARSDDPEEPIFFLTGGPGQSNLDFAYADRYTADHDVVLVGFRGVDGSVRLDCPEVDSAFKRSSDLLAEESFEAYGAAYRACADRLVASGTDAEPVPVTGLAANFSPIPRTAPPPLGRATDGAAGFCSVSGGLMVVQEMPSPFTSPPATRW